MKFNLKLGAEPKKVAILGGLLLIAGGVYFWGPSGNTPPAGRSSPAAAAPPSAKKILQDAQQPVDLEPAATKGGLLLRARPRPATLSRR